MSKLKTIGMIFGGIFLLFTVMGILSLAFVTNSVPISPTENLTDSQKSAIRTMTESCQNNMGYLQSFEMGEIIEKKCMLKVDEKIREWNDDQ